MEWQQVTQSFLPLTREQTTVFASPRDMDTAIASYNRSIRNLGLDSADIALIALRKLAADYPGFFEASLLYGCVLAQFGEFEEARQQLLCTRDLPGLPSDIAEATDAALNMIDESISAGQPVTKPTYVDSLKEQLAATELPPGTAPVVLERTGRRRRVRMASERERREVMRQGERTQPEETHVVMPRTADEIVREVLPIALIVLVAALVIFLGIRFLPGLFSRGSQPGAQERLDYLLTQIERQAPQNPAMQALLTDYSQHFTPPATTVAPTATSAATTVSTTGTSTLAPTTSAGTTSATTTPTTAATTAPTQSVPAVTTSASAQPTDAATVLLSASRLYQEALTFKASDIVRAAEQFSQTVQMLAGIPPQTTAAGISTSAGQLRTQAQTELDALSRSAALKLRSEAQALYDSQKIDAALPLYLRAYALDSLSYGGGVAYYCGRCYQLLGQPDKARPYYQFVIANFAGRDIAASAASRLREIGG